MGRKNHERPAAQLPAGGVAARAGETVLGLVAREARP